MRIKIISILVVVLGLAQSVMAFQPDTLYATRLKIIEKNIPFKLTEDLQSALNDKMYNHTLESERMLTRSIEYFPVIEKQLWQKNLPSELKYLAMAVSGLDPTHVTYNGGSGVWGLQYITAIKYGLKVNDIQDERRDFIKSTSVAIQYVEDLKKIYGNWTLIILAYITSPSDVNTAICRSGNSTDTWKIYEHLGCKQKNLFLDFIASAYLSNYHDQYGIQKKQPDYAWAKCQSFPVDKTMSISGIASYLGVEENILRQANPTIRANYIPGNAGYIVNIPSIYADKFTSYKPEETVNTDVAVITSKDEGATIISAKTTDNSSSNTTGSGTYFATNPVKKTDNTTSSSGTNTSGSYSIQKSYYKVKSGDNLGKIAGKYHVSVSDLKKWNSLKNDMIYVGQKITIQKKVWVPGTTTTTVVPEKTTTTPSADTDKDKEDKTSTPVKTTTATTGGNSSSTKTTNTGSNSSTTTKTAPAKTTTTSSTGTWVTYTVKSGDTLWKIANKYSVSLDALRNNNNISGDKISIGQVLKVKRK